MEKKPDMPEIVYWGLVGINKKSTAFIYLFVTIFIGLFSLIGGFIDPVFFLGTGFFLSSYWYYYSIKWVDEHSTWGE